MTYIRLNYEKRCKISHLLWTGRYNFSQIAKEIGVNKSTITRELRRNITFERTNLGSWQYKPDYAQTYANERQESKKKYSKFNNEVKLFVNEKLSEQWSPEQISGYAKKHDLFSISHERIYQYILEDKEKGGLLYKNLRHQNKKYRKRYGSPKRTGSIKNRTFIDDRPQIVDDKLRIGDWEIDTIIDKNKTTSIVTIVERVSKKTVLAKVERKTAELVSKSTISGLEKYSDYVFTITGDNGSEFAYHKDISKALNAAFYFAHPYSSWERGLNENTNGLIRQYLKKGSSFKDVDENTLQDIMDKLNNRPRKLLGYKTPNEVFLKYNSMVQ